MTDAPGTPSRRRVLATVGASTAAGLAGCLGGGDGSDGGDGDADGSGSGDGADPLGSAAWPMRNFDAAHTGHHPDASPPSTPLTVEWTFATDVERAPGHRYVPVVVGNGHVVTAKPNGVVSAYDEATGDQGWEHEMAGRATAGGGVALVDGVVYASSNDFAADAPLYAIDVESGDVEWEEAVGQPVDPVVADGTIYGLGRDGVVALDAQSGDEVWRDESVLGGRNLAVAGGSVYTRTAAGSDSWQLLALDAQGGDEQWRSDSFAAGSTPRARYVSVGDGTVYATNENGDVFAFDAGSGSTTWQTNPYTDTERSSTSFYPREPPVVGPDNVYIGGFSVHALSKGDGTEVWAAGGTNQSRDYMAFVDGQLLSLWDPGIVAYRPTDGEELWAYDAPIDRYGCLGDVAVTDDRIYLSVDRCVGNPARLFALGPA